MFETHGVNLALFGLVIQITLQQYSWNLCLKIAVIKRNKQHLLMRFDDMNMQYVEMYFCAVFLRFNLFLELHFVKKSYCNHHKSFRRDLSAFDDQLLATRHFFTFADLQKI